MILGKAIAKNFQSFETLEFDYSNQGLALISGVTGAGKSTVMDLSSYLLFGTTSKDLASNEILSWTVEGNTEGSIEVTLPNGAITITRIRSHTATQNDLYYTSAENPDTKIRGLNLVDTQKLINQRLGVDADLFLLSSYLHQFSKSDSFFIAKAKERREVLESIADLSLAVRLSESASKARKDTKKQLDEITLHESKEKGRAEELDRNASSFERLELEWEDNRTQTIADLQKDSDNFDEMNKAKLDKLILQLTHLDKTILPEKEFALRSEQIRTQLAALRDVKKTYQVESNKLNTINADLKALTHEHDRLYSLPSTQCPTCLGSLANNENLPNRLAELFIEICELRASTRKQTVTVGNLSKALETEDKLKASYEKCIVDKSNNDRLIDKFETAQAEAIALKHAENRFSDRIAEIQAEANPYTHKVLETKKLINLTSERLKALQSEIKDLQHKVSSLTWLYDKSFELRGALMAKAVTEINDSVNNYLEKFFDASIRVFFKLTDSDKLDVEIFNNGYSCSFKQLSGGERRMLALTFSISLMRAAQNRAGISFNCVMLDESLNGLSDDLKVKAFGLLQSLENEYSTVLLIDHAEEFKNLFTNKFVVTKTGDNSSIELSV